MKRLLGLLSVMLLALLCHSALRPDCAADPRAETERERPACGALTASDAPDRSVPEMRLEEHGGSGVLVPSGKSRSLSSGSRRIQSIFRNIFIKSSDLTAVIGPEFHYLNSAGLPSLFYDHRSILLILQNLRI